MNPIDVAILVVIALVCGMVLDERWSEGCSSHHWSGGYTERYRLVPTVEGNSHPGQFRIGRKIVEQCEHRGCDAENERWVWPTRNVTISEVEDWIDSLDGGDDE